MSPHDDSVDSDRDESVDSGVVRGAQTVAPIQASALQFAASILGEGSYTPDAELRGTLNSPTRVQEEPVAAVPVAEPVAAVPVAEPVAPAPVAVPVPTRQPVARPRPQAGVVPPVQVGAGKPAQDAAPPKGWFGRFLDKLLGRG